MILHAGDARLSLRAAYEAIGDQDVLERPETSAKARPTSRWPTRHRRNSSGRSARHDASPLFNQAQHIRMTGSSERVTANYLSHLPDAVHADRSHRGAVA